MVKAVDGVDFEVQRAELFGLVGESGRGKTITTISISRLIDEPGRIVGGSMTFYSNPRYDISEHDMVDQCDSWITMIFQQPVSSLNPVFTVGRQVAEVLKVSTSVWRAARPEIKLSICWIELGTRSGARL